MPYEAFIRIDAAPFAFNYLIGFLVVDFIGLHNISNDNTGTSAYPHHAMNKNIIALVSMLVNKLEGFLEMSRQITKLNIVHIDHHIVYSKYIRTTFFSFHLLIVTR